MPNELMHYNGLLAKMKSSNGEKSKSMHLKILNAITSAPVLKPLDCNSKCPAYLSVDSSVIAVGWLLAQEGEDSKRHPI